MADVVKEVASRFVFLSGEGGDCYFSGNSQVGIPLGCLTRRLFKVKVSIQGGEGDTFEMAGEDQLKELSSVAQAVGAKLTIKEVQTFRTLAPWHMSMETFELIAALVGEQEEEVEKVELMAVEVWNSCALPQMEVFVSLVKASKEWTVQSMTSAYWEVNIAYPTRKSGGHLQRKQVVGKLENSSCSSTPKRWRR